MRPTATIALLLCLAACSDRASDQAGRVPLDPAKRQAAADTSGGSRAALSADAAAALDRGNAEFRAGRYDAALASYRAAAVRAPAHAAPHYGIFMVARSTKNAALADSAMAAIRARTPQASSLGDSALAAVHAGGAVPATSTRPLPPGHPTVAPKSLPPGHPPTSGTSTRTPAATPRTGS